MFEYLTGLLTMVAPILSWLTSTGLRYRWRWPTLTSLRRRDQQAAQVFITGRQRRRTFSSQPRASAPVHQLIVSGLGPKKCPGNLATPDHQASLTRFKRRRWVPEQVPGDW